MSERSKISTALINKENDVCQFLLHFLCHLLRMHPKTEPPYLIVVGVFVHR